MRRAHQHDCSTCGEPYDCAGLPEYNHDPDEVRCSARVDNTECEDCAEKPACEWCGEKTAPLVNYHGEMFHPLCRNDAAEANDRAVNA